tara:strand:- start:585 stop:851 length:267 start_codon:yes stop_codon:yes gene_type:complete
VFHGLIATARILRDAGFLGAGNHRRTNNINDTTINDTMKIQDISKDIADFVRDHKKHFDAYPVEVEVSDRVYSYDEYWDILNNNDTNQ